MVDLHKAAQISTVICGIGTPISIGLTVYFGLHPKQPSGAIESAPMVMGTAMAVGLAIAGTLTIIGLISAFYARRNRIPALTANPNAARPFFGNVLEPLSAEAVDKPKQQRFDDPSSIRFINRAASPVEVYWVKPEGERKRYFRLAGGASRSQPTFLTNPWLVVRSNTGATTELGTGVLVAGFEAQTTDEDCAIITEAMVPTVGAVKADDELTRRISGYRLDITRQTTDEQAGDLLRVHNDGPTLISNICFGPIRWETISANQRIFYEHPISVLPMLSPLPSKDSQETRLFVEGIGTMHFYHEMRSRIPNDTAVTVQVTYESDGHTISREFTLNSQPDKDHTIIWRGSPVKLASPLVDGAPAGLL